MKIGARINSIYFNGYASHTISQFKPEFRMSIHKKLFGMWVVDIDSLHRIYENWHENR